MNDENINKSDYKSNIKEYSESFKPKGVDVLFKNLEWLTTAEAAVYLRKSKDAIRQMVCRGQLRARKFHRRLYFKRIELELALDTSYY